MTKNSRNSCSFKIFRKRKICKILFKYMVNMRRFFNFNRIFSQIKKKSSSTDVIKVCPVCLRNKLEKRINPLSGIIFPPTYFCHQCNYHGPLFAEIELEEYKKIDFKDFNYVIDDKELTGQNDSV